MNEWKGACVHFVFIPRLDFYALYASCPPVQNIGISASDYRSDYFSGSQNMLNVSTVLKNIYGTFLFK